MGTVAAQRPVGPVSPAPGLAAPALRSPMPRIPTLVLERAPVTPAAPARRRSDRCAALARNAWAAVAPTESAVTAPAMHHVSTVTAARQEPAAMSAAPQRLATRPARGRAPAKAPVTLRRQPAPCRARRRRAVSRSAAGHRQRRPTRLSVTVMATARPSRLPPVVPSHAARRRA